MFKVPQVSLLTVKLNWNSTSTLVTPCEATKKIQFQCKKKEEVLKAFYAQVFLCFAICKLSTMHIHVIYEVLHSELMKRQLCLMQMMHSSQKKAFKMKIFKFN